MASCVVERKGLTAREVAGSKRTLEGLAGKLVRADGALSDAGYGLLLANHAVQRIP